MAFKVTKKKRGRPLVEVKKRKISSFMTPKGFEFVGFDDKEKKLVFKRVKK
jgi:hypothetical protein